jgi:hypothetical protein
MRGALPLQAPENRGYQLAALWLRCDEDQAHKSPEVTQVYLDSEMHDPEEQRKLDRAGKF